MCQNILPTTHQHPGIGNATLLKEHGIDVLVDLPQVGQNLQVCSFTMTSWVG